MHTVVRFELRRTVPGDATEATPDVGQVDIRIDITPSTAILPEQAEIGISIDVSRSTATRKYAIRTNTILWMFI